ncbi:gamma-glutamyl-gamma-aminobutyrate hydrolase family protein [Gordonia sp. TBRC 11910]|uniref:Gamma-glutamyl-gamma-aminobutyrate hydrolase family protein n=1 Tax=Gordonia asplenii TaxID=2725283 RepID=A0A848L1J0_9ACTN|nr:gamma-glutamyl-gamma-aminobutyrate hydrolase family protein [Gordonia asplenii]NMO04569.1 gamma-glutamyl-gamma-aminobutyrate hydrolase family protein [Gordonia asplenii]
MSDAGRRPLIAIPARFSENASALRYGAEVTARALLDAVYAAGGEPVVVHPVAPGAVVDVDEVARRLSFCDGILLPGGGDLSPVWTGAQRHPEHYDVDEEQDAFDMAVARYALASGTPLLAICRGLQVVTVARGGTLHAHMDAASTGGTDHRHRVHTVAVTEGSLLADLWGTDTIEISCYHHQSIDRLGEGMSVVARADDGTIEAVGLDDAPGWFVGVQWHPEDTAGSDRLSASIFGGLVNAAR